MMELQKQLFKEFPNSENLCSSPNANNRFRSGSGSIQQQQSSSYSVWDYAAADNENNLSRKNSFSSKHSTSQRELAIITVKSNSSENIDTIRPVSKASPMSPLANAGQRLSSDVFSPHPVSAPVEGNGNINNSPVFHQ